MADEIHGSAASGRTPDPAAGNGRTRRGVVIGILLVVLLALAVYFYWRGTGYRDASGRQPPPPAQLP